MITRTTAFLFIVFFFVAVTNIATAEDYTSSSFIIRDPVMSISGGYSSSTNFGHISSDGQTVIGEQTGTTFIGRSGVLYFPLVTSPVVSVTAGIEEVGLSWSASAAELGFNVSGYEVGQSTSAGGPYTFTAVGNVLASTRTGLSGGTTYYFIIRTLDAFGNAIAQSGEVDATPTGSTADDDDDNDDAGGSSSDTRAVGQSSGSITLEGYAQPHGTVFVLRDGVLIQEIDVNADGTFRATLNEVPLGTHMLTFYSVDGEGVRSGLLSFQTALSTLARFASLQLFIPPTLSIESSDDAETLLVSGMTVPGASVGIVITNGAVTLSVLTDVADENGKYTLSVPRSLLQSSEIAFRALAAVGTFRSTFGLAIRAPISLSTAPALRGDFNKDGRVNLIDFSILAYWHERTDSPANVDLNGDGTITLVDFSILTYYWTG